MNKSTLALLVLTAAVLCALTAIRAHAADTHVTIHNTEAGARGGVATLLGYSGR